MSERQTKWFTHRALTRQVALCVKQHLQTFSTCLVQIQWFYRIIPALTILVFYTYFSLLNITFGCTSSCVISQTENRNSVAQEIIHSVGVFEVMRLENTLNMPSYHQRATRHYCHELHQWQMDFRLQRHCKSCSTLDVKVQLWRKKKVALMTNRSFACNYFIVL